MYNSQIPRPAFNLGLNNETFLTLEERKGRLGVLSNITYSNDGADGKVMNRFESTRRRRRLQEAAVDWHEAGATTRVKNQGICGCCWAVSTVAAIESAIYITNNDNALQSLSFQQMISCDDDNYGCSGGNLLYAMRYTWENNDFNNNNLGGLVSFEDYPYEDFLGQDSPTCEADATKTPVAYLNEPQIVTSVNDRSSFEKRREATKQAVAQQPISSTITSNCDLFMSYTGGVMTSDTGCECCKTSCVDHAVVIVGYNETHDPSYWKLRNSWGPSWGEEGYFRIAMDEEGCGWGLFAMLAESAIPFDVYTSLEALPERAEYSWWSRAAGWEKTLVVIAGVLGGLCLMGCIWKLIMGWKSA